MPETLYVTPEQVRAARAYPLPALLAPYTTLHRKSAGWYMLNCQMPGHEDPNPSMSLKKYDDGCWRYKCFGCGQSGDPVHFVMVKEGMTFMDAVAYLTREAKEAPVKPIAVATYPYFNEKGVLQYEVIRYEPKGFRIRRPAPDGIGCVWNVQGVRRVLYRLERLQTEDPHDLYYVEGEKDVQTLEAHGLRATTHAGGASSWRDELIEQIPRGASLILVPDMDDPGKQLMRRIWNAAQNDGRDVHFALLPKGKDVTEFFELGGTVAELESEIK